MRRRTLIWNQPLRNRAFDRRWYVLSALVHVAALLFVRSDAFELAGRGAGRPDPGIASGASAHAFREARPISVLAISRESPDAPVADAQEAAADAEAAARVPESLEEILERFSPASAGTPTLSPRTNRSGAGDGGLFTPPSLRALRWPEVPEGIERGTGPHVVVVRVRVNERGEVVAASVRETSSHTALDEKALEFAWGVRFEPARRDGRAVAAWFTLPITFEP